MIESCESVPDEQPMIFQQEMMLKNNDHSTAEFLSQGFLSYRRWRKGIRLFSTIGDHNPNGVYNFYNSYIPLVI